LKEQILDNTDRKILHALQSDARTSFRKLAADIGLSATPVLQRVKRLEQAGVIRAYRADIDPQQLGLGMLAYVEVALDQTTVGSFDQFERDIRESTYDSFANSRGQMKTIRPVVGNLRVVMNRT